MTIDREKPAARTMIRTWLVVAVIVFSLAIGHDHFWLLLSLYALGCGFLGAGVIARLHHQLDVDELGGHAARMRQRTVRIVAVSSSALTLAMILLVPPYQSPDSPTHMWRAYSLLDNQVTLKPATRSHPENQRVDAGLHEYSRRWALKLAFKPDARADAAFAGMTDAMRWSGHAKPVYSAAMVYFPALYSPAALALGIGRGLDASLGTSVIAARLAMGLAAMIAVLLALCSTRAGFFTMCIVALLPMSLWQFAGANLDTMAISVGLLVAALTTCGAYGQVPGRTITLPPVALLGAWVLMVMLVVTKPVFLAYLLYPAWSAVRGQWRTTLLPTLLCLALVVGWQLHVGHNYVEPRMAIDGSPLSNMVDALSSPIDTSLLIVKSIQHGSAIYWRSMIGILGWLDTPMSPSAYVIASTALCAAACADALSHNALGAVFRRLTFLAAAAYCLGIFLFLLVAWTPAGAERIVGVQGRYFLQVLPIAAMALGVSRRTRASGAIQPAFAVGVLVYALWSMWYLRDLVLQRYWQ